MSQMSLSQQLQGQNYCELFFIFRKVCLYTSTERFYRFPLAHTLAEVSLGVSSIAPNIIRLMFLQTMTGIPRFWPSSVLAPAHSQPAKNGLEERQQTADSLHSHQSSLALWTPHDLPLCSGGLVGCAQSGISMLTLKRQNPLPVLNEHQREGCPLSTSEESRLTWKEKEPHAMQQSRSRGRFRTDGPLIFSPDRRQWKPGGGSGHQLA